MGPALIRRYSVAPTMKNARSPGLEVLKERPWCASKSTHCPMASNSAVSLELLQSSVALWDEILGLRSRSTPG